MISKIVSWAKELEPSEMFLVYGALMVAGLVISGFKATAQYQWFAGSFTAGFTAMITNNGWRHKNDRDRDVEQVKLEQLKLKYNAAPAPKSGVVD